MKFIGINAIFHPRLKYPLVTKGVEPLIVVRSNNWINILIEGIVEMYDTFSYRTQNRGVDLIYLPENNTLKIIVRYQKLKGSDEILLNAMRFYVEDANV